MSDLSNFHGVRAESHAFLSLTLSYAHLHYILPPSYPPFLLSYFLLYSYRYLFLTVFLELAMVLFDYCFFSLAIGCILSVFLLYTHLDWSSLSLSLFHLFSFVLGMLKTGIRLSGCWTIPYIHFGSGRNFCPCFFLHGASIFLLFFFHLIIISTFFFPVCLFLSHCSV